MVDISNPNTVVLTKSQWDALDLMEREGRYMVYWPGECCVVCGANSVPIRGNMGADIPAVLERKGLIEPTEIRPRTIHYRITEAGRAAMRQFNEA